MVRPSRSKHAADLPARLLGEHNAAGLAEIGYSDDIRTCPIT